MHFGNIFSVMCVNDFVYITKQTLCGLHAHVYEFMCVVNTQLKTNVDNILRFFKHFTEYYRNNFHERKMSNVMSLLRLDAIMNIYMPETVGL